MNTGFTGFGSARGTRLAVRLATVIMCAAAVASCKSELYTNLDQQHANQIVATLREHGIPADRSPGKGDRVSVSVDESRFAEAVEVLNDNGLPKQEFATLGEVFKKDGLISSPVQERAQMIFALSQELSETVSEIDGVLSARVHLVLPDNDPLRQQLVPSSASVFIRHRASVPINDLVPQVKMLITNGVAGLSYDKVSVILVPVAERTQVARDDGEAEPGPLARRRDGIHVAGWPLYSLAAVAMTLLLALIVVLQRRRPRIYQLNAANVVKSP
ncbi:type III secretion system inner membrane ring lipoprotein SctJ [Bradyrhizobium sp.]|uniref:type III secretion system inner membrane ring lipoprotein SctJ n=1 Tax=Bradyrhizobium sp. TaxID=376 RepID=UPI003C65D83A